MTIDEAIKQLQVGYLGDTENLVQAKHIAIQALEEIQQYRAIGLTPEMVKEMIESEKQASIQAIFRGAELELYQEIGTVEEFKALKDAEEQGLLLRLPCKVGDMLYHISSYYNVVIPVRLNDIIVSFAGIDNYPKQYNCCSFDECGDVYEDFEFDNSDFGKTVFLAKEEAEQALAEMKEGAE